MPELTLLKSLDVESNNRRTCSAWCVFSSTGAIVSVWRVRCRIPKAIREVSSSGTPSFTPYANFCFIENFYLTWPHFSSFHSASLDILTPRRRPLALPRTQSSQRTTRQTRFRLRTSRWRVRLWVWRRACRWRLPATIAEWARGEGWERVRWVNRGGSDKGWKKNIGLAFVPNDFQINIVQVGMVTLVRRRVIMVIYSLLDSGIYVSAISAFNWLCVIWIGLTRILACLINLTTCTIHKVQRGLGLRVLRSSRPSKQVLQECIGVRVSTKEALNIYKIRFLG